MYSTKFSRSRDYTKLSLKRGALPFHSFQVSSSSRLLGYLLSLIGRYSATSFFRPSLWISSVMRREGLFSP